jgi:hypothetical protein
MGGASQRALNTQVLQQVSLATTIDGWIYGLSNSFLSDTGAIRNTRDQILDILVALCAE